MFKKVYSCKLSGKAYIVETRQINLLNCFWMDEEKRKMMCNDQDNWKKKGYKDIDAVFKVKELDNGCSQFQWQLLFFVRHSKSKIVPLIQQTSRL